MGQKIHPIGFRIGVNKTQSSTWFTEYSVFSDVLKEDYKIRQFFEKEFSTPFKKAGITKLEIKRNINQLDLLIYAIRPNLIDSDLGKKATIIELQSNLKKIIATKKNIRIRTLQVYKSMNESFLVAQFLVDQLEKREPFRKVIRKTADMLQKKGVKGFKIQVSGRLNGAEIARAEWVREGRVPLQTLRADISYATQRANTIYGALGIKVWIFNKEII